jgi:hypothetical protein
MIQNELKGKRSIYIIIFFVIAALYFYITQELGAQRAKDSYTHFDTTSISGKLKYVGIRHHGTEIKVEGIERSFIFYPNTGKDGNIFNLFAEKGDWIIKPKHSDTLKLIVHKKEYFYTFEKFK